MRVIREELEEMASDYGDERRTEIVSSRQDLTREDLITEEERVVTMSFSGYAKTQPLDDYQAQRRGGVGRSARAGERRGFDRAPAGREHARTRSCASPIAGTVYWLKVYEIPVASRGAKGRPLVNLLRLEGDERITSMLPVGSFDADRFVFMATSDGTVKKTPLDAFSRPRGNGLIAHRSGRGRPPGRHRDHRRQQRRAAVQQRRQGGALQGVRGARDGPHRARRARHAPGAPGSA